MDRRLLYVVGTFLAVSCTHPEKTLPTREGAFANHPLHEAVARGDVDTVQGLLAEGVHPGINHGDDQGCGPLHLAFKRGLPEMIDLLIKHGASIEARDKMGRTPLFYSVVRACQVKYVTAHHYSEEPDFLQSEWHKRSLRGQALPGPKVPVFPEGYHAEKALVQLKSMLDRGAKVDVTDRKGMTPLHYAALIEDALEFKNRTGVAADPPTGTRWGNATYWIDTEQYNGFEAARLLITQGADPRRKTLDAKTPLDLCLNLKTRELLRKALEDIK